MPWQLSLRIVGPSARAGVRDPEFIIEGELVEIIARHSVEIQRDRAASTGAWSRLPTAYITGTQRVGPIPPNQRDHLRFRFTFRHTGDKVIEVSGRARRLQAGPSRDGSHPHRGDPRYDSTDEVGAPAFDALQLRREVQVVATDSPLARLELARRARHGDARDRARTAAAGSQSQAAQRHRQLERERAQARQQRTATMRAGQLQLRQAAVAARTRALGSATAAKGLVIFEFLSAARLHRQEDADVANYLLRLEAARQATPQLDMTTRVDPQIRLFVNGLPRRVRVSWSARHRHGQIEFVPTMHSRYHTRAQRDAHTRANTRSFRPDDRIYVKLPSGVALIARAEDIPGRIFREQVQDVAEFVLFDVALSMIPIEGWILAGLRRIAGLGSSLVMRGMLAAARKLGHAAAVRTFERALLDAALSEAGVLTNAAARGVRRALPPADARGPLALTEAERALSPQPSATARGLASSAPARSQLPDAERALASAQPAPPRRPLPATPEPPPPRPAQTAGGGRGGGSGGNLGGGGGRGRGGAGGGGEGGPPRPRRPRDAPALASAPAPAPAPAPAFAPAPAPAVSEAIVHELERDAQSVLLDMLAQQPPVSALAEAQARDQLEAAATQMIEVLRRGQREAIPNAQRGLLHAMVAHGDHFEAAPRRISEAVSTLFDGLRRRGRPGEVAERAVQAWLERLQGRAPREDAIRRVIDAVVADGRRQRAIQARASEALDAIVAGERRASARPPVPLRAEPAPARPPATRSSASSTARPPSRALAAERGLEPASSEGRGSARQAAEAARDNPIAAPRRRPRIVRDYHVGVSRLVRRRDNIRILVQRTPQLREFARDIETAFEGARWAEIQRRAGALAPAFAAGGRRRLGAIRNLKGLLQEAVFTTLPWHRRHGRRAANNLARINQGLPPHLRFSSTVHFTTAVSVAGRELTDGIYYALSPDRTRIVLLDIYEAKSRTNWTALYRGSRAQIRRDINRVLGETITVDGHSYRHSNGTLRLLPDFGMDQKWTLSVPRAISNAPRTMHNLRAGAYRVATGLRSEFQVVNGALSDADAELLAEIVLAEFSRPR